MDPQLDVNALIKILNGIPEFVTFALAKNTAGLTYNQAGRIEFLASGHGTERELELLEQRYNITLLREFTEAEIDEVANRLKSAFTNDSLGRSLSLPGARILATVFLNSESLATGDLQLFKRAEDLGLSVHFVGSGRAAMRAAHYVPRPVKIPGLPCR